MNKIKRLHLRITIAKSVFHIADVLHCPPGTEDPLHSVKSLLWESPAFQGNPASMNGPR